jgi:predicted dehydrogenase
VSWARHVRNGRKGNLRTIQTFFNYFNDDPTNVRNDPTIGGGAVLHIGCYPISQARHLFDDQPDRVVSTAGRI